MIRFSFCLLIPFLLFGCGTSAQLSKTPTNPNCFFNAKQQKSQWILVNDTKDLGLKPNIRKTKQPTKFIVYQINYEVESFLKSITDDHEALPVNIPLEDSCITFLVTDAKTMSPELSKKFPDMYSLKGTAVSGKNTSIRINYHNQDLKMEINKNGQIYFLNTWEGLKGTYYLLYKKEDAGYEKLPGDY